MYVRFEKPSHSVVLAGFKLAVILLPQPLECQDYRCALLRPTWNQVRWILLPYHLEWRLLNNHPGCTYNPLLLSASLGHEHCLSLSTSCLQFSSSYTPRHNTDTQSVSHSSGEVFLYFWKVRRKSQCFEFKVKVLFLKITVLLHSLYRNMSNNLENVKKSKTNHFFEILR